MQEFPSPNFKSFNKALNKKILFPLDRKYVSTSRNEEIINKIPFHLTERLCLQPGLAKKWEKNCFSLARKTVYTRSKEVFL